MPHSVKNITPWLDHKPMAHPPTGIVMHSTAGDNLSGAVDTLREKGYAYGYIIDKDGTIYKCVPAGSQTSHAGESFGWAGPWLNHYSIGVSFVNLNTGWDHPVLAAQVDAAVQIVLELKGAFPSIKHITTHRDVSPGRKTDPLGFDMPEFAKKVDLPYWDHTKEVK